VTDKDKNPSFSFDTPEKDPAIASFEALLSEQPKDDDSEYDQSDSEFSDTDEDLSEESNVSQSQIEIKRAKVIRSTKRRKKKIIFLTMLGGGAALLISIVVLLVVLIKPSGDNNGKPLSPKEQAALKAAKIKEELDALMVKAEKLFDDGKTAEALSIYKKVLEADDSRSAAHLGVGKCLESANKLDDAMKEYELAVELTPETTAPFTRLAHALIEQKDKAKAKTVLEKGVSKFPEDQDLLLALANLCYETNDSETALDCYKKLDTGNLDLAEIKRYATLLQYESKEDAKKLLVTAARKFKNFSLYLFASQLAKDDNDRLTMLLDAEKEMGDDQKLLNGILFRIAKVYAVLNQTDKTKEYLEKIVIGQLDPELFAPVFELARESNLSIAGTFTIPDMKLTKDSKDNKTLAFLLYMLNLAPEKMNVQLLVLRELEATMSVDKVLDVYGDLWSLKRKSPTVCFLRAKALQDASIVDSALKYYMKAIDLKPDFYNALLSVGKIHLATRNTSRAGKIFKKCVKLRPKADQPRKLLAETEIMMGRDLKAMENYSKFLNTTKLSPSQKTLQLAKIALRLATPKVLDECLAKLNVDPAMAGEFKKLTAKRKLLFGGAKLSDFAGAKKGLFRQYKMIYLLSRGELTKVLTVRTPKEEFPDFWKVFVMLEKRIIKRKKYQPPTEKAKVDAGNNAKNDIITLLYEKTRKSPNIPEKMAAAIWNGKRNLEYAENLLSLIPMDQLALYYFLQAVEYKHTRQLTKARIRLRKAMSAPRSVYRPLIEHAYKQYNQHKRRRKRR